MEASRLLRREPEFREVYFDAARTAAITAQVLEAHAAERAAAEKGSEADRVALYGRLQAEIIEGLVTPELRADILARLTRCGERLITTNEVDKLEAALLAAGSIKSGEMAWSEWGLVAQIYHDSLARASKQFETTAQVLEDLLTPPAQGDAVAMLELAKDPARRAALEKELQATPGLREQLEKESDKVLRKFEQDVAQGRVVLDLFSPAEMELAPNYMAEYLQANGIDPARADSKDLSNRFIECMRRSVRESATPARRAEWRAALEAQSLDWLRLRKREGALLQMELALWDVEPEENPLLLAAYIGQGKRMGEE